MKGAKLKKVLRDLAQEAEKGASGSGLEEMTCAGGKKPAIKGIQGSKDTAAGGGRDETFLVTAPPPWDVPRLKGPNICERWPVADDLADG